MWKLLLYEYTNLTELIKQTEGFGFSSMKKVVRSRSHSPNSPYTFAVHQGSLLSLVPITTHESLSLYSTFPSFHTLHVVSGIHVSGKHSPKVNLVAILLLFQLLPQWFRSLLCSLSQHFFGLQQTRLHPSDESLLFCKEDP